MFKKLALSLVLSCALLSSYNTECGPISGAIGYWVTKSVLTVTSLVVVPTAGAATIICSGPGAPITAAATAASATAVVATTGVAVEGASVTIGALCAMLPLP